MNTTATQVLVGTLFHTEDIASVQIFEGESNIAVLEKIKAAGYNMGATSLRRLLNGELKQSCGFGFVSKEEADATVAASSLETEVVPETITAEVVVDVINIDMEPVVTRSNFPMAPPRREPAVVAPVVVKSEPAATTDETEVVATTTKIKAMRRDTKNDKVFKMLCGGATIKEIYTAMSWTEGGASSVVYWEPNDKGYSLIKEKVEGRGLVIYLAIDGKRINESQIVYTK